jgi:hypothetical protein
VLTVVDAQAHEQGEMLRDAILERLGTVTVNFACEVITPMFVAGVLRSAPGPMRKWLTHNCLIFTGVKPLEARMALESARDRVYAQT